MNKYDRRNLAGAAQELEKSLETLSGVAESSRDSFDNYPEPLQETEQGQKMDEDASQAEELHSELEDLRDRILELAES